MRQTVLCLVGLLLVLGRPHNSEAQTIWKVIDNCYFPAWGGMAAGEFSAIGNWHQVCTVAAHQPVDSAPFYRLIFKRSNDGGKSWLTQIPPVFGDFGYGKYYV